MADDRLTAAQRSSVQAAILVGFELDEFAARHSDWPQAALRDFWGRLNAEIKSTKLKPGQYWGGALGVGVRQWECPCVS